MRMYNYIENKELAMWLVVKGENMEFNLRSQVQIPSFAK